MQHRSFLPLTLAAVLVLAGCSEPATTAPSSALGAVSGTPAEQGDVLSAAGAPVVFAASGSGDGIYESSQGTANRTFSFNAHRYADGSVSGMVQVNNRAGTGLTARGDVICIGTVGQGIYGIGVELTHVDGTFQNTGLPNGAGGYAVFAIRDNGEPGNDPDHPDQFTQLDLTTAFYANLACSNPAALGFTPAVIEAAFFMDVQRGNIQVRP